MPSANVQKAYIQSELGDKVECWFNPKDFSIAKNNTWTVEAKAGAGLGDPQFGGGQPSKISIDLLFDESDNPRGDVRKVCDKLFDMMKVNAKLSTSSSSSKSGGKSGGNKTTGRPPTLKFGWGRLITFKAVCDSLSVQYTLFDTEGTPIRANAKLQLTQVAEGTGTSGGQNPTTRGLAGLGSHVVRDGDSLQSIAYAAYGDPNKWRAIAEVNGIDDPTRLERGRMLTIPRLVE